MIEFLKKLIFGSTVFTTNEFREFNNKILNMLMVEMNTLVDSVDKDSDGIITYGEMYNFFKYIFKEIMRMIRYE